MKRLTFILTFLVSLQFAFADTAPCPLVTVTDTTPYTYGFEDATPGGSGSIPCWSKLVYGYRASDYGYFPYVKNDNAHTGNKCAYFYFQISTMFPTPNQVLIFPEVTNNANSLLLKFWAKKEMNDPASLQVGVMTDAADTASFVQIGTDINITNTYVQYEVSLASYTGTGKFVAIRCPEVISSPYKATYICVDDVELTLLPSCPKPFGTSVYGITWDEATVAWSAGSDETLWNLQYRIVGDSSWTMVNGVTNPYTLTGIDHNTSYELRAQADCGDEQSEWSENVSFTTICAAIPIGSMPFTENFEGYAGSSDHTNGIMPDCWHNYSTYSIKPHIVNSGSFPYHHSGSNSLSFAGSGSNYAVLPCFDFPLNAWQISFWRQMEDINKGTLTVGYIKINDVDMNTFTAIQTIPSNILSMEYAEVLLNTIPDDAYRLAIKWSYQYPAICCIDDITISQIPTCIMPDSLSVTDVTSNAATLTWVSRGDETAWDIRYKPTSDTVWQILQITTSLPATIPSLLGNTEYEVQVRSNCSDEQSDWTSSQTFTTPCSPMTPSEFGTVGFEAAEGFVADGCTLDNCWQGGMFSSSITYCYPRVVSENARSGNNSLYMYASYYPDGGISRDSTYAIFPEITFTGSITNYQLKFYMRKEGLSDYMFNLNDTIWVGVVQDPADMSSLEIVGYAVNTTLSYNHYRVSLSGYTGGTTGRIVFLATVNRRVANPQYKVSSFNIDDISLMQTGYLISSTNDSTCDNTPYNWRGHSFSETGIYRDTIHTGEENDSIYELNLTVYPTNLTEDSAMLPNDGSGYLWHGITYYQSGDYVDTLVSMYGCDSVVVLHLSDYVPSSTYDINTLNVTLIPNPVKPNETAYIYADWSEAEKDGMSVEILTAAGTCILSFRPETFPIAIDGINTSGTFLVRITAGNGEVHVMKIVSL